MKSCYTKSYPKKELDVNRRYRGNLDSISLKKPAFMLALGCYWIPLDVEMVEAGGIEPPSESAPLEPLHA